MTSSTPPEIESSVAAASTPSPATVHSSVHAETVRSLTSRRSALTVESSGVVSVASSAVPALPAVYDMSARDDVSETHTVEYVQSIASEASEEFEVLEAREAAAKAAQAAAEAHLALVEARSRSARTSRASTRRSRHSRQETPRQAPPVALAAQPVPPDSVPVLDHTSEWHLPLAADGREGASWYDMPEPPRVMHDNRQPYSAMEPANTVVDTDETKKDIKDDS